jgi:hypothetical protein
MQSTTILRRTISNKYRVTITVGQHLLNRLASRDHRLTTGPTGMDQLVPSTGPLPLRTNHTWRHLFPLTGLLRGFYIRRTAWLR